MKKKKRRKQEEGEAAPAPPQAQNIQVCLQPRPLCLENTQLPPQLVHLGVKSVC